MSEKCIFADPLCGEDGIAKDYCGTMKNNSKSKGMAILNWIILAFGIILVDVLFAWVPQFHDLFPDDFSFYVAMGIVNLIFVGASIIMLGLPGLLSLLKLFDVIAIFWLAPYIPGILAVGFWIELFPAVSISILLYYIITPLCNKKQE